MSRSTQSSRRSYSRLFYYTWYVSKLFPWQHPSNQIAHQWTWPSSSVAGHILYELQAAEVLIARQLVESGKTSRILIRKRLQGTVEVLKEAITIFELSHPTRMLAESAKTQTLAELENWIASLKLKFWIHPPHNWTLDSLKPLLQWLKHASTWRTLYSNDCYNKQLNFISWLNKRGKGCTSELSTQHFL